MLVLIMDAVVLIVLLKTMVDEDVGVGTACLVALGASIAAFAIAAGLAPLIGILFAVLVAASVSAAIVGVVVSAMFGVELKQACVIGVIFTVVHTAISLGMAFLFA